MMCKCFYYYKSGVADNLYAPFSVFCALVSVQHVKTIVKIIVNKLLV